MSLTLQDIIEALGGEIQGDAAENLGQMVIDTIAPLQDADTSAISFIAQERYAAQLDTAKAACIIVSPALAQRALDRGKDPSHTVRNACIVTPNPYLYFARLTQLWKARHARPNTAPRIHPSAVVSELALVHDTAQIGPLCVVEAGARIGANTVLKSRVTVYEDCELGARCIVHSGVVIGADGFGFAQRPDGSGEKIEQLGRVLIGNDVELGANTCIDRGALGDTVIADGVKMDNLVQVGHNVRIGAHTALAGCVGIAGSAVIGSHCFLGGGAIVLGHLTVADHVQISAASVVTRSISKSGHYTGMFPLDENSNWEKNAVTLRQLHRLRDRIRQLERRLEA